MRTIILLVLIHGMGCTMAFAGPSSQRELTGAVIKNGAGKLMMNATGSATIPSAVDTLVGRATTDTLTNKTLTAPLVSGGAFTASTLASPITTTPLVSGGVFTASTLSSAVGSLVAPLVSGGAMTASTLASPIVTTPLVSGGVFTAATFAGAVTTPLTASRALVTSAGSALAVSATTATELGYVSGVTSAIQTQLNAITAVSGTSSAKINNCSLAASVGSSALTVALKDATGSDPSVGSPCTVAFRDATATTGTYADVAASAALSVVVSNGSALGCTATVSCVLYVYAVNNAGAMVLGVFNGNALDEGTVQSGVAEGGAGGADTAGVLYTAATQSSKAVRLLGRITITPAASFAWTNAAAEISNVPFKPQSPNSFIHYDTGAGRGSTNGGVRRFANERAKAGTAITYTGSSVNGDLFTISEAGIYNIHYCDLGVGAGGEIGIVLNGTDLTSAITSVTYAEGKRSYSTTPVGVATCTSATLRLVPNDIIRGGCNGNNNDTTDAVIFSITKISP